MLRLFRRDPPGIRKADDLVVSHAGESYKIAMKRMRGARRFTLRVRSANRDVVLTMPLRGSATAAREFAERHAAWIGVRMRRLPEPILLTDGAVLPLRGVLHRIEHRPHARGVVWIEEATPDACAMNRICVAGEASHVARRVADFMRREAKRDIEAAVHRHCAQLDLSVKRISLRDTTSRWGSCSATGGLNFSWRLIMAPGFVLDYLAAHEVAHLVHLDHSGQFWAVARKLSADTDRAEAWLKAHGADLHRYAPRD